MFAFGPVHRCLWGGYYPSSNPPMPVPNPIVAALFAITSSLIAQDMIAVTWSGQIHELDSFTGVTSYVGSGLSGQNAAARDDHGRIWSTAAGNTLSVLDPNTPNAMVPLPGLTADLRGLANAGAQYLWGIENGPSDMLVSIDKVTGAKVVIGSTGYSGIEALEQFNYSLYVWDATQGLLMVNRLTGAATDVNPAVGGAGVQIAWLSTRSDGKLIGGQTSLYQINVTTGVPTLIAGLGGLDVRGADAWQSFMRPYGNGCNGVGGNVAMTGSLVGTQTILMTLQSGNHAPNSVGATLFGVSTSSSSLGQLPVALDPLYGTAGCSLYTSIHASALGVTSATTPATLTYQYTFNLLNDMYPFFAQQVTLEPVAGGFSMSNGMIVQLGR